ncbi:flagellar type III secretion system pore protein FliP [Acidithrix ferrooxidans]|uniref:flagellar type III secretion system pore protein FliP n=1 Tax=Acidithrix ferrooxidans TaxID=1280514 RepID=UPI0006978D78
MNLGNTLTKPSQSIIVILLLSLLSIAPSLLIMMTSFVRIIIVLSITKNALGLSTIPPSQVLTGLALFMTFFIMAPTFTQINNVAVSPYLNGKISAVTAYNDAQAPLKTWMLKQTRTPELALFTQVTNQHPAKPQDISMSALVPAFMLSELKSAFIIGFVIYIPFMIVDLVVASILMSMGMMMIPPTLISLPFKLLLFVLVDGWTLVVHGLLVSFR